jgi:hypothetical protein
MAMWGNAKQEPLTEHGPKSPASSRFIAISGDYMHASDTQHIDFLAGRPLKVNRVHSNQLLINRKICPKISELVNSKI